MTQAEHEATSTTIDLRAFAVALGQAMQAHLAEQETQRSAVSRLAVGGAFEAWLAFEARLLLEAKRAEFGLAELRRDPHGAEVYRHFITNEYCKVDLGISTYEDWVVTVEFKLIHNNKNWKVKCNEVASDLWPGVGRKATMRPTVGRLAAVAVVGKVYRDSKDYPGQRSDLEAWEHDLWKNLLREDREIQRLWTGSRICLTGERLLNGDPRHNHFFELHMLTKSTRAPGRTPHTPERSP